MTLLNPAQTASAQRLRRVGLTVATIAILMRVPVSAVARALAQ